MSNQVWNTSQTIEGWNTSSTMITTSGFYDNRTKTEKFFDDLILDIEIANGHKESQRSNMKKTLRHYLVNMSIKQRWKFMLYGEI